MSVARRLVRSLVPPALLEWVRDVRARLGDTRVLSPFEYAGDAWPLPVSYKGWDVADVARAYASRWPAFVAAIAPPQPLSVSHETVAGVGVDTHDGPAHTALVTFAYVLTRVAGRRAGISLLDWGGALGHYSAVGRSVVPDLAIDYHCRETASVVEVGRWINSDVTFHADDACLDRRYDLVLASSSLQYTPDWTALLGRLANAAARFLFVTRLPLVETAPSFVVIQRAHAYGYGTEYPGWFVNRAELLRAVASLPGFTLAREFRQAERVWADGAPEIGVYGGFLLERVG